MARASTIALAAAVCLVGCSAGEPRDGLRNVLLISIDTLRSDHLGCYGYDRPTSPNIDGLARSGTVFLNTMSVSSWTLPAHASMLTGRYPGQHGLRDDGVRLDPAIPSLPQFFRKRGYRTLAVVSHVYVSSAFGLDRGFDVFDESLTRGGAANPVATQVVDRFLGLLEPGDPEPFFAFLHFFDPHLDYVPPSPFGTRFTDPGYRGEIDGTLRSLQGYFSRNDSIPRADLEQAIGLYDGEIAYVDSEIGRLLEELERRELLDDTIIVITADHGEEFKEHGRLGHARTLFEEQLRVPLIISGHPAFPAGSRRGDLAGLCDLAPTLLELTGAVPEHIFSGRSLIGEPGERDRSLFAETLRFGFEKRAARRGSLKAIDHRHDGKRMFFDLAQDPGEQRSAATDPTGGSLAAALDDYTVRVDSGWHIKLIGMNHGFRVRGVVRSSARLVGPRHYFSGTVSGNNVRFAAFETAESGHALSFDVAVRDGIGEIVFETEPREAEVTLDLRVLDPTGRAALFLGRNHRVDERDELTLARSDPRLLEMPRDYFRAEPGVYVRAVTPLSDTAPRALLTEETIEHLRTLGYIE
jgi:arylsulfatase A-like enzyme